MYNRTEIELNQFKENIKKENLIGLMYLFRNLSAVDIEGQKLICKEIENRINNKED